MGHMLIQGTYNHIIVTAIVQELLTLVCDFMLYVTVRSILGSGSRAHQRAVGYG